MNVNDDKILYVVDMSGILITSINISFTILFSLAVIIGYWEFFIVNVRLC